MQPIHGVKIKSTLLSLPSSSTNESLQLIGGFLQGYSFQKSTNIILVKLLNNSMKLLLPDIYFLYIEASAAVSRFTDVYLNSNCNRILHSDLAIIQSKNTPFHSNDTHPFQNIRISFYRKITSANLIISFLMTFTEQSPMLRGLSIIFSASFFPEITK